MKTIVDSGYYPLGLNSIKIDVEEYTKVFLITKLKCKPVAMVNGDSTWK